MVERCAQPAVEGACASRQPTSGACATCASALGLVEASACPKVSPHQELPGFFTPHTSPPAGQGALRGGRQQCLDLPTPSFQQLMAMQAIHGQCACAGQGAPRGGGQPVLLQRTPRHFHAGGPLHAGAGSRCRMKLLVVAGVDGAGVGHWQVIGWCVTITIAQNLHPSPMHRDPGPSWGLW